MRSSLPIRTAVFCLWMGAVLPLMAQLGSTPAARQQAADRRFLLERGVGPSLPSSARSSFSRGLRAARQQQAERVREELSKATPMSSGGSSSVSWQPLGPIQLSTSAYGPVTGRVSSLATDPNDTTGNTVYLGATGGGVWKSTNAAGNAGSVTFAPLTDDLSVFANSFQSVPSLSIGALTVEPGSSGVVLAGTGDPNDALDSYYGVGILRSTDGGGTWSLIPQSSDGAVSGTNYSFVGVGFAGFAWSSTTSGLVVAAASQSLEGLLVDPGFETTAETGLYYSQDAGQTWHLATVSDGQNEIIQSSNPATHPPGNPATAVVWNPQRRMFLAAIRFHGYYSSSDGINWTRLASQPGANLTATNCPAQPGSTGSPSCPIFRGALAVQPVTGDTFALTTDLNNADQGLYRDVCSTSGSAASSCSSPTVTFGTQIADSALDDPNNPGIIDQADYNLSLSAVSSQQDTLLFAGTEDIYRCSLANSCAWRNTTNDQTCAAAGVAPSTHAIDGTYGANGLVYFGNDGGLWRSTDAVAQTGAVCASTDASHYQNLNGGLGSLAEISHLAVGPANASLVLAGMGGFGIVASESAAAQTGAGAWQQLLTGEGSYVAMDPVNPAKWFASNGEGVSIFSCGAGGNCSGADFGTTPAVGRADVEDDADSFLDPAPWTLDPGNTANILLGTCRMWLGPASGGWTSSDLLSGMLDGVQGSFCDGNAYLRSVGAGGSYNSALGGERMYAGMAGPLDGGGSVPGHIYGATVTQGGGMATWTDLEKNPVTNTSLSSQFNGAGDAIAAIAVDPHDATGQTLYVGIAGFPSGSSGQSGLLYSSTDGGAHWANITNSLPFAPVNAVVVDPSNARDVYVGGDFGVYYTNNISGCVYTSQSCWAQLGGGLPNAPVTDLKIASTDTGNVLEAATYGRGIWTLGLATGSVPAQATLSPSSYTFPASAVGAESGTVAAFTLANTGSVALTIGQITVAGDYGQTNNCGGALAVGANCTIQVSFTPTATGDRPGTLTVRANTQSGALTASLDGTGLTPGTLTLTPTSLSFGQTATGTSSQAMNVAAQNTGGAPLTLGASTIAGADPNDFSVANGNTCTGTLAPGATCTVPVVFNPVQTGGRSAQLGIAASAQGSPFLVALTGSAVSPPQLTLTPTSLAFPSTTQNSTSQPQNITVGNSGGQTAQLGAESVSGDFGITASNCPSTLAPGSSCTVGIVFKPTAAGSRSGLFTLASTSAPNGQVTAALSGNGIAAAQMSLSPASLAYGAIAVGGSASQTATLSNGGGSPATLSAISATGDYAVTGGSCSVGESVAVGSSCSVIVTFSPTALGSRAGTLSVSSNGLPATVQTALNGSGATPASLAPSPSAVAFGPVALGTSAAQTIAVTNSGGAPASLGTPSASGAGYSVGSNGCGTTLAGGGSCSIEVVFTPAALGESKGTFTLPGQFSSSPVTVALDATGAASVLSLQPSPVTFASQVAGTTSSQTVTVTNVASGSVALGPPSVSGGFTLSSACGASLQPGASCTLQVSFAPTAAGAYSGTLAVPTPGDGGPATDALSGTATAPGALRVQPTTLTFAPTLIGSSAAQQTVTFRNSGGSTLTLSAAQISAPDYTLGSNTCGTTLAAGGACTIAVAFTPSAAGARSGTLTLGSTANTSAQVALNGTGVAPASLSFSPASVAFGGQYLNTTSAAQTVVLRNTGGVSTSLGAPAITGQFTITANSCGGSLGAGASCNLGVEFGPTASGAQAGTLTVPGGAGTPAGTAALSGTGWVLEASPSAITFTPPLTVGAASAPVAVAIANLGPTALNIGGPTITGDFSAGPSSCGTTLPADSTCAVYITFKPTAGGLRSGVFTVSDGAETHVVQLAGTGLGAATDTLSPPSLTFGATTLGQPSAAQNVTLTNSGDSTLAAISVTVAGPFTAANNCGASLGGHLTCTLAVSFDPIAVGASTGSLIVTDAQRTQTVALNGTGAAPPAPSASPLSLDFGPYAVNVPTAAQTVTVINGGGSAMENMAVTSSSSDFAVSASNCGASLPAGANCRLGVIFTPSAIGSRAGTLEVTSSTLATPLSVSLAGAGEDFSLAVVGSASQVITAGQTATYQLTVTPVGASAGTVTLGCSGAPANATCTPNPSTLTLSGGASGSVTLSIATGGATTARNDLLPAGGPRQWWRAGAAMALVLPLVLWPRKRTRLWPLLVLFAVVLGGPVACGVHASGANKTQTKNGTYTVTVTAGFPGAQRTATVSLVVQ